MVLRHFANEALKLSWKGRLSSACLFQVSKRHILNSQFQLNPSSGHRLLGNPSPRTFFTSNYALERKKKGDTGKFPSDNKDKSQPDKEKEKENNDQIEKIEEDEIRNETTVESDIAIEPYSGETNSRSSSSIQKPTVPENYPQVVLLPMSRRPLFPGFYKSVVIKDPLVISAVKDLLNRGQPYIGAFMLKDDDKDTDLITNMDQVYRVGVFAQIANVYISNSPTEDPSLTALLFPHRRILLNQVITPGKNETSILGPPISHVIEKNPVPVGIVENLHDEPTNKHNPVVKAISSEIVSVFKEIASLSSLFRDQIAAFSLSSSAGNVFEEPGKLADFAAAVSSASNIELQAVLESLVIEERMQKALVALKKELLSVQLQNKISKDVDSKITKRNREYYLMEQLKGIKKELGMESDGKEKLIEQFKAKAGKLQMTEEAKKVFDEELNKLSHLEPQGSEFNVTRNYLDWIVHIPWGKRSKENYSISGASKVLDEDHYGLKDVKERILEFIVISKLKKSIQGKIICLCGPPGVGKTSIGRSIARALGREYYRFSVGGLTDVAEIKGHRRTYIGAMPGKIIQSLKKVQTENPLILIDEVDKIGNSHRGDPASALLELLDPEQNSSFLDHYMDIPVDLSKVLFVCTANVLDTIPGPLLDRMEVINLSGYVAEEKMAIAKQYLIPQALKDSGLNSNNIQITDEVIDALIKGYCRESGVRNLKKHIERVTRKAAFELVGKYETSNVSEAKEGTEFELPKEACLVVRKEDLKKFVGSPLFTSDRLYDQTPAGVIMGLAWTALGGSSIYIESVIEGAIEAAKSPGLSHTGRLGDVMKESTAIAYTYARSFMGKHFPENKFFDKAKIHLHVPEGATPKDGPSAGITMATSLLSLALNEPVHSTIAMTGELSLTGKVLKIGGLKEKAIAAKRSGVRTILFPESNRNDWEELPDYIKQGLEAHPVQNYQDVFKICFPQFSNGL